MNHTIYLINMLYWVNQNTTRFDMYMDLKAKKKKLVYIKRANLGLTRIRLYKTLIR
jgi:hypothetical protein